MHVCISQYEFPDDINLLKSRQIKVAVKSSDEFVYRLTSFNKTTATQTTLNSTLTTQHLSPATQPLHNTTPTTPLQQTSNGPKDETFNETMTNGRRYINSELL